MDCDINEVRLTDGSIVFDLNVRDASRQRPVVYHCVDYWAAKKLAAAIEECAVGYYLP